MMSFLTSGTVLCVRKCFLVLVHRQRRFKLTVHIPDRGHSESTDQKDRMQSRTLKETRYQ